MAKQRTVKKRPSGEFKAGETFTLKVDLVMSPLQTWGGGASMELLAGTKVVEMLQGEGKGKVGNWFGIAGALADRSQFFLPNPGQYAIITAPEVEKKAEPTPAPAEAVKKK